MKCVAHSYTAKIGKTADEISDEMVTLARAFFTPTQIHAWEAAGRRDAEAGTINVPGVEELKLAQYVYLQAYSRRKYKLAKAKREQT